MKERKLEDYITSIKDWPKEGIVFRDINTLLNDKVGYNLMIDKMYDQYKSVKESIDYVAGCEARGFIVGAALAHKLGAGFVPIRKKGKLPREIYSQSYDLEYGSATLEVQKDAIIPYSNVLLLDDLLATGGTMIASIDLMEKLNGNILGCGFIASLDFLGGEKKINDRGYKVKSLIRYK